MSFAEMKFQETKTSSEFIETPFPALKLLDAMNPGYTIDDDNIFFFMVRIMPKLRNFDIHMNL